MVGGYVVRRHSGADKQAGKPGIVTLGRPLKQLIDLFYEDRKLDRSSCRSRVSFVTVRDRSPAKK